MRNHIKSLLKIYHFIPLFTLWGMWRIGTDLIYLTWMFKKQKCISHIRRVIYALYSAYCIWIMDRDLQNGTVFLSWNNRDINGGFKCCLHPAQDLLISELSIAPLYILDVGLLYSWRRKIQAYKPKPSMNVTFHLSWGNRRRTWLQSVEISLSGDSDYTLIYLIDWLFLLSFSLSTHE